jgi:hypothetical protein
MQKWQDKEKKDSERLGSRRTPRSGGFWSNKGDHKDQYFLYDSKDTAAKSYILASKTWQKIYSEAIKEKRMPALSIRLGTGEELIVLSLADFTLLKEGYWKYETLQT